jgi:predicted DCC family thiol-disulfide oxidoreductase YuxK
MTELAHPRFSYRADPNVSSFPDGLPLVVYDGVCGLCSGWVRFILRRDGARTRHLFASAQSGLGQALYRHYGLSPDNPETLLVIKDGRLHTKGAAVAVVLAELGFPWRLIARLTRVIPSRVAERAYDLVARNRYRIGGRRDTCMLPPAGTSARFIG